jgi:peptidylprolyl isomerase
VSFASASPPSPATAPDSGASVPAGGHPSVDGANTVAPDACPLCGAPLRPEQEWCLQCGAAARTRLATSSNWRAPIIAVAVVVALSLGVLAASLVTLAGEFGSTTTATTTVTTAQAAGTPTTTTAAPTTSTPVATTPATTPAATTPNTVTVGTASGPLSNEPKVTPPPGPAPTRLEVKDLVIGNGPAAVVGKTVTVNYVGVLFQGGVEFDASWKRNKRFTFTIGRGQVIAGWDQGVPGMKVGGRRELVVPPALAYGAQGFATVPPIPPNATLVFVVDLLKA